MTYSGILPGMAVLGGVAAVALFLTLTRSWSPVWARHRASAAGVALIAVLVQAAHFSEEYLTGFHHRFPALFGQPAMPDFFFISFNLIWLIVWALSIWGLKAQCRLALFPLWFLGLASVLNGIAHPLIAAFRGAYFPGLFTAPLGGIVGIVLCHRLFQLTGNRS